MQGEASNSTAGVDEHVADESRGPYFPFNRRETYPPRLKVDFRRLPASVMHEVDVVLVVLGCFVQHVVLFGRSRRHGCSSNRHLSLLVVHLRRCAWLQRSGSALRVRPSEL